MTKSQYLAKLKHMLPEFEAQDILNDFEEHFVTGLAEGKTEEEIVISLGDPVDIAKEYGYVENVKRKTSITTGIITIIGLLFFDLIIGIALVATVFAVWVSLWSLVLSLFVFGIAGLVMMFVPIGPWYLFLFAGFALLGLAGLLGIGMIYVSKYFFKGIVWYGRLHVKAVTGE